MNNVWGLIFRKTNLSCANSESNLRWSCVSVNRWLQLFAF
jgi:hypothetical protein